MIDDRPLAIDLCAGLCGWGEGLIEEGWRVRAYDIEDMFTALGEARPEHVELIVRNVLEMHGSEIADAELIVASPPCTEYSYMAMPWSRAKQIARALRGEDEFPEPYRGSRTVAELNAIFDACFRLQREASEAAGRYIPMIVENVKGAQPWVGRAAWSFGSFFLWGDIPALMPVQRYHQRLKVKAGEQWNVNRENFTGTRGWDDAGLKKPGENWSRFKQTGEKSPQWNEGSGSKNSGGSWFNVAHNTASGKGRNPVHALTAEGVKGSEGYERDHPDAFGWKKPNTSSGSKARKAASAKIAKIPLALSSHIARVYRPERAAA